MSSTQQTTDDEQFAMSHLDKVKDIVIDPFLNHPNVLESLIERYSNILQQASELYHYDVPVTRGGTTGGITSVPSEVLAYWSFDLLITSVSSPSRGPLSVASLTLPTLLRKCEDVLRRYIDDVRLRGRVPLPR